MGFWDFLSGANNNTGQNRQYDNRDTLDQILGFPVFEFNANHRNYERFKTGLNESGDRYEHYDYIKELYVRGIFDSITVINFPESEYYNLIFEKDQVYLTHNPRIKELVNDLSRLFNWERYNKDDEHDLTMGDFWIGRMGKTTDGTNLEIMLSMTEGVCDMSVYGLKKQQQQ